MAIGVTARSTITSTANLTSYSTGAFTPTASELLVAVYEIERGGSINPTTPTVSGHDVGTAWLNIDNFLFETDAATRRHLHLYACITGASPGSATVTFDHGATTHVSAFATVFEISGASEANGLSQTFVQVVRGPINAASANSTTITLAASGQADNRPFAVFFKGNIEGHTPRTSWTEIHDVASGASIESQWRSDIFETTASASWTTALTNRTGIAWEIKALGVGHPTMRRLGSFNRRTGSGSGRVF